MNNEIFESIIEITRQKDTDSLEYSLAATLAELIDIDAVTLLNVPYKGTPAYLSSELRLTVKREDDKKRYKWDNQLTNVDVEGDLKTVISHHQPLTAKTAEGHAFYFPVVIDDELNSILRIDSKFDVMQQKDLINGFVRIYQNYQVILTENERDKLTGLLNRKTFENKLNRLLKPRDESATTSLLSNCWLVMIDIDHFKSVNDNYGHVCGDEILLHLSQLMKDYFVNNSLLFRFGGEEFVIVLEYMPMEVAIATLEHFKNLVSEFNFPFVGNVTISLGFSQFCVDDFPPSILDQADKALYYAKEHGRNCLHNYEQLILEGKLSVPQEAGSVELF